MPGPPPPPPPPPMFGGAPPPPPPMGGLNANPAPNRADLLKSIADPSKPRLRKVDPNLIKDRSKPTIGNNAAGSSAGSSSVSSASSAFSAAAGANSDNKSKLFSRVTNSPVGDIDMF
jgi:hypothetical protein